LIRAAKLDRTRGLRTRRRWKRQWLDDVRKLIWSSFAGGAAGGFSAGAPCAAWLIRPSMYPITVPKRPNAGAICSFEYPAVMRTSEPVITVMTINARDTSSGLRSWMLRIA
jgi:hypothetical protein